jgi:outer membrane protein assembly factor BamB
VSRSDEPPLGDGQVGPGRTDDPMSADRRVLAVAAISMVALVLVGVVSAQLFTRSACASIDPEPIPDRSVAAVAPAVAGEGVPDVGLVAAEAFPDLPEEERDAVTAAIAALEGAIGPLATVADVRGADGLRAVDGGVAAIGSTTTLLDADGAAVQATVDVDEGTVVGSGSSLFSLALVNPLTGQVDALQAVDPGLAPGPCIDTATVGTPLAFHLDAGDGELLVLRTEEDGDEPAVELRDPLAGSVWSTELEVGTAPAGVLAERVTARLGVDTVVAGWRTVPSHEGDAVALLDRDRGEVRWKAPVAPLREAAQAGSQPLWVDVLAVGEREVLVTLLLEPEEQGQARSTWTATVAALDLDDGTLRWHGTPGGGAPTAAFEGPSGWVVAGVDGGRMAATTFDEEGELVAQQLATGAQHAAGLAGWVMEDGTVAIAGGPLLLLTDDAPAGKVDGRHAHGVAADVAFVDVVETGGRVHVLARSADGALLLSFDRAVTDG